MPTPPSPARHHNKAGSGGASPPALHQQLVQLAGVLQQVRGGASMPDALSRVPAPMRAGCQALGFHVMRWRGSAEAARAALVPRAPAPPVDALLTCALALMWPPQAPPYPPHTLVDEAVKAASRLAPHSKGFINAVLRNAMRQGHSLQNTVMQNPVGRHNHPTWWIERLRRDWPEQADAILDAAQSHPPLTLRAHARHGGLAALGPALDKAGMAWQAVSLPRAASPAGRPLPPLTQAAVLAQAVPVDRIPGFAQGHWSVQDAAAQLAAPLIAQALEPAQGAQPQPESKPHRPRVLDACAAPGGKTAHLLELLDIDWLALDSDAQRLERVADNLQRLRLPWDGGESATHFRTSLRAADARQVASWWDGEPFDAVLLDAPCSASGIVRRQPDARWLRRESDVAALVAVQAELLDALWPLVRPGGCLLYATCSVFKAEGQDQIDAFLQRQSLPASVLDPGSPGHLLPLVDNEVLPAGTGEPAQPPACDGFFYALLHKPLSV